MNIARRSPHHNHHQNNESRSNRLAAASPRRRWFNRQPAIKRSERGAYSRSSAARSVKPPLPRSGTAQPLPMELYQRYAIRLGMLVFWGWFLAANAQRLMDLGRAGWAGLHGGS